MGPWCNKGIPCGCGVVGFGGREGLGIGDRTASEENEGADKGAALVLIPTYPRLTLDSSCTVVIYRTMSGTLECLPEPGDGASRDDATVSLQ